MKEEQWDCIVNFPIKRKEKKLPESWEEYYKISGVKIPLNLEQRILDVVGDRATAEAVLALCQLIQLRNAYNEDWMPDWTNREAIYMIVFVRKEMTFQEFCGSAASPLFFKSKELREKFFANFHFLIRKLKPLYDIKEGGEEC